jgi:hypothetical protein
MNTLANIADLTTLSEFSLEPLPGQWISWDFRGRRVYPTRYTISGRGMGSWVLEGSLDGESWTVMDEENWEEDFKKWNTASFAVANPMSCYVIRLTHPNFSRMSLRAVEFFGAFIDQPLTFSELFE